MSEEFIADFDYYRFFGPDYSDYYKELLINDFKSGVYSIILSIFPYVETINDYCKAANYYYNMKYRPTSPVIIREL